jgi:hypothetical protein
LYFDYRYFFLGELIIKITFYYHFACLHLIDLISTNFVNEF